MCDEADNALVSAFCSFWLLVEGNNCNFSEILGPLSSFIYMLLISYVYTLRPSSPNSLNTSPGTSSSPVAFLFLISLLAFYHSALQNGRPSVACIYFLQMLLFVIFLVDKNCISISSIVSFTPPGNFPATHFC